MNEAEFEYAMDIARTMIQTPPEDLSKPMADFDRTNLNAGDIVCSVREGRIYEYKIRNVGTHRLIVDCLDRDGELTGVTLNVEPWSVYLKSSAV